MAGKTYLKTGSFSWSKILKIYMKTGGQTWSPIRKAYMKTSAGWRKVYDTTSNRPYIGNNDIPKIRLNTFRTNSTYDPTGTVNDPVNPVVEAPTVQQMGPPTTTPTSGWPNGTVGNHLWGYDGTWVSGNGSTITFTYQWLFNYTGNKNDNRFDPLITPNSNQSSINCSSTGRADMLTNTSTYLGYNDGDYFDKNFITFRVGATNSAGGPVFAESEQVYIVRQLPSGTISMVDPDIAQAGTTMSASFSWSNSWYNKADQANSYIEWFMVSNLTDALTTTNRVQGPTYLNTFTSTGTTTLSATSFLAGNLITSAYNNKYAVARLTLNNSASQTNPINSFTPKSPFTVTANKNVVISPSNGPFSLTNATKTANFYNATALSFQRNVSVNIGQSQYADRYEIQIEGQYVGSGASYSTTDATWVVLQSLAIAPYVYESNRVNTILSYSTAVTDYRNYRFTARSRNGSTLNGAAYSDGGSSTSYVYVTAPEVAPNAPVISNIQTATDTFGSYITFDNSLVGTGSNTNSYYEYSVNNGTSWSQIVSGIGTIGSGYINDTNGKIYLTAGTTANLRVRAVNLDLATGPQSNLLSIVLASQPGVPTSVIIKSFSAFTGHIFFTAGSNTASVRGYLDYDSVVTFDSITNYVNVSSGSAGVIALTGANSNTRVYSGYTLPYSQSNATGNQGALTFHNTKTLNGSDAMTVSLGTPTLGTDTRTINMSWTLSAGAPSYYTVKLINYNTGLTVATKTVTDSGVASRTVTFTSADGVAYSTVYYLQVIPAYQYAVGVIYQESTGPVSANITSGGNFVTPSITDVVYNGSGTMTVTLSGTNIGPYYQIYWNSVDNIPGTAGFYDAAGTTTSVSDSLTPLNDVTYYFKARSSNVNLGNIITSGTATDGTYGSYSTNTVSSQWVGSTVTYNATTNGGSTGTASTGIVKRGTSVTLPTATRAGYSFTGWYTASTGGTLIGAAGASYTVNSTLTVYAQFAINPRSTGSMRRVSMPTAFNSSSQTIWVGTNGYVSTTVDPTTSPGTSWPSAGGVVVGPFVMDLQQTALFTKSDASNFYVRYQGYRFGATSETVDYLMKFTWGSTTVDVYFITNNLTIEASADAVRSGTSVFQTWAGSTLITGMTIPTGMTTVTTAPTASADDGRTAITASAPVSLTPPTITSIQNIGGGTLRINFSGGSGPYFQVYWLGSNTTPSNTQTSYDAATNSSTTFIDEALSGSAGTTYYFWVRSSNQNIATTTVAGLATAGTFSNWSGVGTYTFPTVDQSTAPSAPAAPTNGWTSGTSYPFTWSAPTNTGLNANGTTATITGYTLEVYKADNSSGAGTYTIPWASFSLGNVTSYLYTSDDSAKYYAAAVKATNSAGKTSTISGTSAYK